jgi:CRISPR-associated protein Csx3
MSPARAYTQVVPASPSDVVPLGDRPAAVDRLFAPRGPTVARLRAASDFGLTQLASRSGLLAQITPGGAPFAIRHEATLINQYLPGPSEDGLFRLILRWRAADGTTGWAPLVGTAVSHRSLGTTSFEWTHSPMAGLSSRATLTVHPDLAAWAWRVRVANETQGRVSIEVLLAQDLGLAGEAAVRNSEAFNSQYIDLLPVEDAKLGWTILARQNQPAAGGCHPWLAVACAGGAAAFCTDGRQFFGGDHRVSGVPAAARGGDLQSRRLQYECALAGLQSRSAELEPRASDEVVFVARFLADHPAASSAEDLERVREVLPADWALGGAGASVPHAPSAPPSPSLFVAAPWLHGDRPAEKDWAEWFPGERRHEERGPDGGVLSFFHGIATHVVSRDKEAVVARPHGHILRSGGWRWVDPAQFGTTCYAAGIFSAQAYLGNPTFARLLPVVRDPLGIGRAAGQRVFLRRAGAWQQLGVPSAFAMTPAEVRWIYRVGAEVVTARVWCSRDRSASFLDLRVGAGGQPAEFLVSHTLTLGANEFEHAGELSIFNDEGWASCEPDPESVVGRHNGGVCFAIAAADADGVAQMGGDELLFEDGRARGHPCLALRTAPVVRFGIVLCGTQNGAASLPAEVEAARKEWRTGGEPAGPPPSPVRLAHERAHEPRNGGGPAPGVARLDEMLPWLAHNAAIHFSSPHGLEQHGGAAWGVRDVCQGSAEWLLAGCEWPLARRMLETVFAQQYAHDGSWPQWFMHPPYRSLQQAQSHGDVCFWPVKALCDYLEASNDLAFLGWRTGYTDPEQFTSTGPEETLLEHCDRVVDQCEARFVPGTALVNYGDGDWDDTLQPADPSLRTRMISSWTVGLAFHTFRQLTEVLRRAGEPARQARLEALLARMRSDFAGRLMPGLVVAGFLVTDPDGTVRALLHPSDRVTGIRYRLLPMTRAILAELFTPEEAARHRDVVNRELLYPDGVRLMSEPAAYSGGRELLFKRAETAANVGREIGLQYVHAHLRYAEAMSRLGEADRLWEALQVVNPVGLREVVGNAMARQSNVYFSSSDPDFHDRIEAARRWEELRTGSVRVRGGWRLYSSGPGLFIHTVRSYLLGIRESFGRVVFDPVLPLGLDGLSARVTLCGRPAEVRYRVGHGTFAPRSVRVNGVEPEGGRREPNPYRAGGLSYPEVALKALLSSGENSIIVEL